MLQELRIRGLGVIDEAVLSLGPGLTVVTGETGAGKTMVVTGLLLMYGGRADAARVRTGCDQATVDGRLAVPAAGHVVSRVRSAGGDVDGSAGDDAELVVRRVVTAAGRSRAYAGGAGVPVSVLGELAEHLIAVHGQADQQHLVRASAQRAALDRYAGVDLTDYAAAYDGWRAADTHLAERVGRAAELRRETDLLTHGLEEIEAVDPQPGEDVELARASARLADAEGLSAAAAAAHDALLGDADDPAGDAPDVSGLVAQALRQLSQHQGADPQLDALAGRLTDLGALAADLGAELRAYAEGIDRDPARLEHVESRRAALQALVRKYCDEPEPSVEGVLRWARAAADRLATIDVSDEALQALRAERDAAAARAATLAEHVSAQRRTAAERLGAAVTAELAGLAMADARLEVSVRPRPAAGATLRIGGQDVGVTADGADEIELLLQAHPSAPALPIGRGASGGELSRIMLAIEVCLAESDPVPTLVFDEVDAGVGGRAAVEVGRRLARLARHRQVLVVTHLAQVAAFADRHVVVDRGNGDGVRSSDVRTVGAPGRSTDERVGELARMLGGTDTRTAREHAAELLATAAETKAETDAETNAETAGASTAAPTGASTAKTAPRRGSGKGAPARRTTRSTRRMATTGTTTTGTTTTGTTTTGTSTDDASSGPTRTRKAPTRTADS